MIVRKASVFPAPRDEVLSRLQRLETLQYIAAPYGDHNKKTLLVMHGMLCDWRKFREIFMPLEKEYHVIYPAMTGCYELRLCNTHPKIPQ